MSAARSSLVLLLAAVAGALAAAGCGDGDPATPPAPAAWEKYAGNPVLAAGPPGSWDALGAGAAFVLARGPGAYEMWYSGRGPLGTQIGRATSNDGVAWVKDARNPVFGLGAPGTWDALGVGEPCVILDGAGFAMYYAGTGAGGRSIGLATSPDGIEWTRSAETPVFTASPSGTSWDDAEVYTPWVLGDGGGCEMWYGAKGTDGYRATGRATSDDGISWTRLLAPVLDPQALEALTFGPCVIERGGMYRLWCVALHETPAGGVFPGVIDYAQSSDGIDWTRNRLALAPGEPGTWDAGALRAVCVVESGDLLQMWYEGQSAGGTSAIGLATLR